MSSEALYYVKFSLGSMPPSLLRSPPPSAPDIHICPPFRNILNTALYIHTLISRLIHKTYFSVTKQAPRIVSNTFILHRIIEAFGSKETLQKEAIEMRRVIEELNSPLVFSHNDTLSGNIIYNNKTG